MKLTEKDTSSGRDIREYRCSACGYEDWEDRGTALWQILSDAREEAEAKPTPPVTSNSAVIEAPKSRWKRFLVFFHRSPKNRRSL